MSQKISKLSVGEFDNLIRQDKPVLIDFTANWCVPCKMLSPVIEKIADQYDGKVTVAKVDIDEQQDLAIKYGIMNIPTVILFKNGKPAAKEVGVRNMSAYTKMLDKQLS